MVSGHRSGTECHTVCLSLVGGPVSLFFKLLYGIGQQMRSAHSPHPHCRDCRVLAERMVRMSSLGSWRRGAIMIANQPPSYIPSGACTGPSPLHRPPCRPHPLPAQLASASPHSPSPWPRPAIGPVEGPGLALACVTGQEPLFLGTTLHVLALSTDAGMAVATAASAPTAVEDGGKLRGCERNRESGGREHSRMMV